MLKKEILLLFAILILYASCQDDLIPNCCMVSYNVTKPVDTEIEYIKYNNRKGEEMVLNDPPGRFYHEMDTDIGFNARLRVKGYLPDSSTTCLVRLQQFQGENPNDFAEEFVRGPGPFEIELEITTQ